MGKGAKCPLADCKSLRYAGAKVQANTRMSNWHYYNEKGEKIAVTGGQLKGLAKAGRITPETIVETEDGKTAPARKVKGLTFVAAQPVPMPDIATDSFSFDVSDSSGISSSNPYFQTQAAPATPIVTETSGSGNKTFKKAFDTAYNVMTKPVFGYLLLDFRFRFFLTPVLLKIIWCMWVVIFELLLVMLIVGIVFGDIFSVGSIPVPG